MSGLTEAWRVKDLSTFYHLGRHPRSSRDKIQAYQNRMLRRLMAHAYERVPYYRAVFDGAGVKPGDIRTAADLQALPLTSKLDLKERPLDQVLARGYDRRRLASHTTTGSTGEPFTILRSPSDEFIFFGVRLRTMRDFGLKPRDRMARVAAQGRETMPASWRLLQALGFYRADPIPILDPPRRIVRAVLENRADVLTGDSGVLTRVSREFESSGIRDHSLRFLVAGSELLTPNMRRQILDAFRRPVYDTYVSEEFSVIAWECKETGLYHVADDSLILEVLRDGRPASPGETGEAVVTSLHFRAMPFVRYRLGDEVRTGPVPCPCGQPFSTLSSITGRMTDYLCLPGGREIYAAAVAYVFQKRVDWIRQYEMIQEKEDEVVLRAVVKGVPAAEKIASLNKDIQDLLGEGVRFSLNLVDELKPGPGGKYRVLRSRIRSFYDKS